MREGINMFVKYRDKIFELHTSKWILSIGQCWIDKSFGFMFFPQNGQIKIKKILRKGMNK